MTSPSRRELLALIGTGATASWNRMASAKPLGMPIGLQPYTVRHEMEKDVEGTLKKIAAMGYEAIELSDPFHGKKPAELRPLLKSMGLATPACHYSRPKDKAEWEKSITHAKSLGVEYMITVTLQEWMKTLDGWKRTAEHLNQLGAQCRKAGVFVAYHNHHFEYKIYDGVVAYDELLRSTDPNLVKMEMDCFWTTFAGKDPVAYFDKHPGRFALLHIKDLKPGWKPSTDDFQGKPYTEVGSGIIDYKRIFKAAPKAGVKHYFVEQDEWDRPALESARISCDYLKKLQV